MIHTLGHFKFIDLFISKCLVQTLLGFRTESKKCLLTFYIFKPVVHKYLYIAHCLDIAITIINNIPTCTLYCELLS